MKVQGKVILVTGGGSGIGRNLVLQLVQLGAEVATLDIHAESLKETVEMAGDLGEKISTYVVNIADKQAVENLPNMIISRHGQIDGIINNAGIIQPFTRVQNLDYSTIERVINVNLWGPIYITKTFLPYLLERPEAHIVNVSSMGGFFPFPGQTIYGATKAAVKLLTEGLHSELSDTNVNVTVVFPGAIQTNITSNSGLEENKSDSDNGGGPKSLPAEKAAEIIISAMENNKYSVMVGSDAKMMDMMYRLSPKRAAGFINKQMGDLIAD